MSPEVIGVIVAIFVATLTLASLLLGGVRFLLRQSEVKSDTRFNRLEQKLDVVAEDVVELKVAVARLEGPQPTLLRVR